MQVISQCEAVFRRVGPRAVVLMAVIGTAIATGGSGLAPGAAAQETDGRGTVRTGTTGNDSETVETIRIGRRVGDRQRVVMSLQPGNLGDLRDGDRLEASAEVEVSVCLKPNQRHGSNRPCIGRTYGYDPRVRAKLALAAGGDATGGVRIARDRLTCAQSQPNRNHHCVLVLEGAIEIDDASSLPCNVETCHLNLVLSAGDGKAKGADKLVVGADSGGRSVNGDKGRINFARYRPGAQGRGRALVSETRVRRALPIAPEGGSPRDEVIYSVELGGLEAGEQLVIDGRAVSRIAKHPYNVFQTTSLVLSEGRHSTSREGWPERVGDLNGQIAEANGFNCTQGESAHEDPCRANKVGVLEITRDSPKTLYVNLTAGMAAQADFNDRHSGGDVARVLDRGYLRVYRYGADVNDSPPPVRD